MPGQSILTESFANADVSQLNWLFGTSRDGALPPILTARSNASASAGGLPGGGTDTPGNGVLRLTNNTQNQGSFVIYDQPINSASGLSVQFDLYAYGGNGADGISFFLIDGAANPTRGGAVGGSLGYSSDSTQSPTVAGLEGGYLGIGFDEFGNFSNTGYGAGGTGFSSQTIAVRGKESLNYQFLTNAKLPGGNRIDVNTSVRSTARRRVGIDLNPNGNLSVSFDVNGNGTLEVDEKLISDFNITQSDRNGALPSTFKFGFAASTGNQFNFHEVNNLAINTFDGPYIPLVDFDGGTRVIKPSGSFNITATLDVASTQTVTIPLLISGDAIQGIDYQLSNNFITIAAGQTTGSVTLTGLSNSPTVLDKNLQINLNPPVNAALSPQNLPLNVKLTRMSDNDCALPDFNGDNSVDLAWQNSNTNQTAIWLLNGTQVTEAAFTAITGANWRIVSTRDFDADGKTDLLWRNTSTGENAIWLMDGTSIESTSLIPTLASQNWQVAASRDFNNDGTADIFWVNSATGETEVWLMDGFNRISATSLITVEAGWQVADVADFNYDGKADLVWRNTRTGENAIWLMNGNAIASAGFITLIPNQDWRIVAARDTSGDGKADLIWRNDVTGENAIWLMNGITPTSQQFILQTTTPGWRIADVCDTSGDGKADLVWRNIQTGENAIWLLNGTSLADAGFITQIANQAWAVNGARDTSGDGKADLIWRNNITGETAIWLMDGKTPTSQQFLFTTEPLDWRAQIRPNAIAL
ncbi:FG-GAP repeat-containing protein [Leptolyngbya boryana NIES-2135]|jgi:hypothetical protein|uniref:FG-GAP repeat-containing protein n=1 Tax=Leptolyngbya boryana NIES-2135 TaxID=1973484 RepID=A0A1Z4JQS0_LEPBY|nr:MULTISPECIES: FG-GAP-like repeat-containing protein [Leptolyngbya]BAY59007.1 FG-GAP repeat-containing protein [Leptolyngbya boryana NIES-2135]MBD2368242.1 VCBS repeat-containing protein [Leptolyngbya sp. FACHB-161]MBD2374718.1 VCBS repeat-containing protein [Leptolyngbya sp. FACHB-238]MBD2399140.1 VCBS repeat-containing protein [Leptolyngbya sp. FACHB-239]MBD2405146.1 VCBS repeat-containing protein [Leptolyngbya sp. FACHB-402]